MFRSFGVVVIVLLMVLNKTYLLEAAPFPGEREDQQSNESRYDCMWMSSSESGGEPKLICIPKLQLLDVIRMRS